MPPLAPGSAYGLVHVESYPMQREQLLVQKRTQLHGIRGDSELARCLKVITTRLNTLLLCCRSILTHMEQYNNFGLVLDGESLQVALQASATRHQLLRVATRCQAVLCCRMSPMQKAEVSSCDPRGLKGPWPSPKPKIISFGPPKNLMLAVSL